MKIIFTKLKVLLVIALLSTSMVSLKAQFEIKGLVGTNFSTLSNLPDGVQSAAKAGYQFGFGVLIGDKFYVEPGLQFVRKAKLLTDESAEIDFSQNYLKIPVYAGYHLLGHESGPFALRAFAGPVLSIPGKIKKGEDQVSKDDINNAIFAVDAGLGLDIFFLFVELNYEYSFSQFWSDNSSEARQQGFIINAGVHFDF